MGDFRKVLVLVAFTMLSVTSIGAQSHSLKEALSFENYAMAGATTGIATGLGDIYKNPAGLASLDQNAFSSSYGQYFNGAYNGFTLAVGKPLGKNWVLGLTLPSLQVPGIPESISQNGQGVQVGTGTDSEWSAIFSLGWRAFSFMKLGTNVNYYKHTLFGESLNRISLDIGSLLEFKWISVGLAAHNLGAEKDVWSTGREETSLPWVNAGVSIGPIYGTTLVADTKLLKHQNNQYSAGFSSKLNDHFAIQGGFYDFTEDPSVRLGTTLTLGEVVFHYAYGVSEELGTTQKFGVTVFY